MSRKDHTTAVEPRRFEAPDANGQLRQFTVDSQVMDYFEPARAFRLGDLADAPGAHFQPRLLALPDRSPDANAPMVLALDQQRKLVLVRRGGAGSTGWARTDLSAGLAAYAPGPVTAFGAAWHHTGDRVLATLVAAIDTGSGDSRVLIAYDVDLDTVAWDRLAWTDYGTRANVAVAGVRVWRDADGVWMTLLSAASGFGQQPYLVRSDQPRTLDAAFVLSPATDLDAIFDLQAGPWRSLPSRGYVTNSILYVMGANAGGGRVLSARTLEFDASGQPQVTPSYGLHSPAGASVLAVGRHDGVARGADLYVGGAGVSRLTAEQVRWQEKARWETVIPDQLGSPVRRLLVAESDGGAVSVWALLEDGQLITVRRLATGEAWSTPLAIRTGVADIAPGAADGELTSSVLVIYAEGDGTHLWRDDEGIWQEAVIVTADPADATRISSLGTQLCVMDADGLPAAGVPVTLWASIPSSLVVNGQHHYVGPTRSVQVRTAANGGIVVFNRALSFAPAIYRLQVDGMDMCLDLNPATALYQRFSTITADELRDATLPGGGEHLLAPGYRGAGATASLEALAQALRGAARLGLGGDSVAAGVRVVKPLAPYTSEVTAASLPAGYGFGLASDGAGALATPLAAPDAAQAAAGDGLTCIGDSVSDFLHSVWSSLGKAAGFVVQVVGDVVEVVCTIGRTIKRCVLTCVEQIGAFFEWACDAVSTAAGKVWDFVKFLFDWDDIVAVRNRLAELFLDDLDQVARQIGHLKGTVGQAFEDTLAAMEKKAAELGVPASRALATKSAADPVKNSPALRDSPAADATSSGPGAWVMDQLEKFGRELITFEVPQNDDDSIGKGSLIDDLQDNFTQLCRDLGDQATQIFGDDFKVTDLDAAKLQKLILAVAFGVAKSATKLMRDVVNRMLDALLGMIALYKKLAYTVIRLPFLEKLLKLVGVGEVDTSFRLIDMMLLLPAVLTTVTFKLMSDVPLSEVLKAKLPPPGALAAQSLPGWNELKVVKDIGITFISYIQIVLDAPAAMLPMAEKVKIGKFDAFKWVLGALGQFVFNFPLLAGRADRPASTKCCDTVVYLLGCVQSVVKGWNLYRNNDRGTVVFQKLSQRTAELDTFCFTMQLVFRTIGYVADDKEKRDGWEFVHFCGRIGAQDLMQIARLIPDPFSKGMTVLVAQAGILGLYVFPRIDRHLDALGVERRPRGERNSLGAARSMRPA
ncbi:MAG: hypothetical protein ABW069_18275 [Duganella sp.]